MIKKQPLDMFSGRPGSAHFLKMNSLQFLKFTHLLFDQIHRHSLRQSVLANKISCDFDPYDWQRCQYFV